MQNKWLRLIIYILIAYLTSGLFYSITGFIYQGYIGYGSVFSPLLGISLDMIGWPWMVYADLKNFGLMMKDIAAILVFVVFMVFFIRKNCQG